MEVLLKLTSTTVLGGLLVGAIGLSGGFITAACGNGSAFVSIGGIYGAILGSSAGLIAGAILARK